MFVSLENIITEINFSLMEMSTFCFPFEFLDNLKLTVKPTNHWLVGQAEFSTNIKVKNNLKKTKMQMGKS